MYLNSLLATDGCWEYPEYDVTYFYSELTCAFY